MKKFIIILLACSFVALVEAKGPKKSKHALFELGPKGNVYIGNGDTEFGIGVEGIINPIRSLGIRFNITEIEFTDPISFYLNYGFVSGANFEVLYYIPMPNLEPYIHAGLGLALFGSQTSFLFSGGMGFNYQINPMAKIFVEPGVIICDPDVGNTQTTFRLSLGARFGMFNK